MSTAQWNLLEMSDDNNSNTEQHSLRCHQIQVGQDSLQQWMLLPHPGLNVSDIHYSTEHEYNAQAQEGKGQNVPVVQINYIQQVCTLTTPCTSQLLIGLWVDNVWTLRRNLSCVIVWQERKIPMNKKNIDLSQFLEWMEWPSNWRLFQEKFSGVTCSNAVLDFSLPIMIPKLIKKQKFCTY